MLRKRRVLLLTTLLLFGLGVGFPPSARAQEDPLGKGSAGVGLLLRKLDGVKRVLLIGAHPDDEDTSLLSALSRGMGVETAYLSLSRGEGGQNLIGNELDEGLGLVRTGELLAARSLDGGRQFFTRAFDFGYSKTAEETFRYWPREEILADVTWVVRTFRPHVIVSVFSGTSRDGHGQHQVAGLLAQAVFETAGDPAAFPGQLDAGAHLWTPAKLYRRTRFGPEDVSTSVQTGQFDPLLGRSHHQLAMESRSQHRSQDMGMPRPLGPRSSNLALMGSHVGPVDGEGDSFFAGVDTTLQGLLGELPVGSRQEAQLAIQSYRDAISTARNGLDAMAPWSVSSHLIAALRSLEGIRAEFDPRGSTELGWVLDKRIPVLQEALLRSKEVVIDVRIEDDLLVPGEEAFATVAVWNGGPEPVAGVLVDLEAPLGWIPTLLEGPEDQGIPGGEIGQWRFSLTSTATAEVSRPYFLGKPREGETYQWPASPEFWGAPNNPLQIQGKVTLQLAGSPAVQVRRTAVFKGVDKATGEFVKPVLVVPALSVSLDPGGMLWPASVSEARDFSVRVTNLASTGTSGMVALDLPDGWTAEPREYSVDLMEPGAEAAFPFTVTPPRELTPGAYTVGARVTTVDGEGYEEGFSLVDYPHIPRSALFSPAEAKVSVVPVAVDVSLKVGYVMGSGDMGAEVLAQMGLSVEVLGPEKIRAGEFQGLDVVVLGIRAYETRPDLVAANDRLLDFAREGGTLIVQYNKYEYPRGGFAPFPVEMSRPHDRVSDETVPVTILDPTHKVFNHPNRIGAEDFRGWAQERGLYFLSEWDERFFPLLEMSDPGEGPKRGGLLVAPLGQGLYVYTGLAFFRQFPEGVPGAYRLFANLVSLKGSGSGGG